MALLRSLRLEVPLERSSPRWRPRDARLQAWLAAASSCTAWLQTHVTSTGDGSSSLEPLPASAGSTCRLGARANCASTNSSVPGAGGQSSAAKPEALQVLLPRRQPVWEEPSCTCLGAESWALRLWALSCARTKAASPGGSKPQAFHKACLTAIAGLQQGAGCSSPLTLRRAARVKGSGTDAKSKPQAAGPPTARGGNRSSTPSSQFATVPSKPPQEAAEQLWLPMYIQPCTRPQEQKPEG
mmetsp:Transcript_134091/g.373725  ORF Transcript_134091/g.373725 Transcript_134091/m.373725 type:complete len:241 (-) Transcript_134091:482-1204(-)